MTQAFRLLLTLVKATVQKIELIVERDSTVRSIQITVITAQREGEELEVEFNGVWQGQVERSGTVASSGRSTALVESRGSDSVTSDLNACWVAILALTSSALA